MKTITKFICTAILAAVAFNTANMQVFASVGTSSQNTGSSYVVHRDSSLSSVEGAPNSSGASASQDSKSVQSTPSSDGQGSQSVASSSMPSSSTKDSVASGSEPFVSPNGEYAVYLGMSQELPNQTPIPTPTPKPTPVPSSSTEDSSSAAQEAMAKPEKVKLPPTCKLCNSCNGFLGVCLYVWIAFVIIFLLCILTALIMFLNAGSPKKEKVKKSKTKTASKIHLPKINLPAISPPHFKRKNELKIIKTKVKRSNKAKRFNIGSSVPFASKKNTSFTASSSVEDTVKDTADDTGDTSGE